MNDDSPPTDAPLALHGVRILSLSLNLPGPAALQRCRAMGATCIKLEPPAPPAAVAGASGDPMSLYSPDAYAALHEGVTVLCANLKTEVGQATLHTELEQADVLLTSFRPSALPKLGLDWLSLHSRYPKLSMVAIVGAPGARADEPGHDLTYLAENDLLTGLELPATLYADMGGALMASEAILQSVLMQRQRGHGHYLEVALSEAAAFLAQPRRWGLTLPGTAIGGGHAGYRVYRCRDGRVALAALEPHFARRLCQVAGVTWSDDTTPLALDTHRTIAAFVNGLTRAELDTLARQHDLPLHTLAD